MDEPIGRKSIKRTLEKLKAFILYKSKAYEIDNKSFERHSVKFETHVNEIHDATGLEYLTNMWRYRLSTGEFIYALSIYIDALESYLSELDETFDQALEKAKRMAEEQIKELPRERQPAVV